MHQEFSPKDQIIRSLQLWWVLAACIILGGLAGYYKQRIEPPIYQAKAIINTFIDFQDINDAHLTEYDEDMTINSVQAVMLSTDVIEAVVGRAASEGVFINYTSFMQQKNIYRMHADYELFYRDSDPEIAKDLVNLWAETGVEYYKVLQDQGEMPLYITVMLSNLADLPLTPSYAQTNTYVLSGSILGFILGIVLTSISFPVNINKTSKDIQKSQRRT
jgi:hypothetical protein